MKNVLFAAILMMNGAAIAAPGSNRFVPFLPDRTVVTRPCVMMVDGKRVDTGSCNINTTGRTGTSVYTEDNGCVLSVSRRAGKSMLDLTSYRDVCVPRGVEHSTDYEIPDISPETATATGRCFTSRRLKLCM